MKRPLLRLLRLRALVEDWACVDLERKSSEAHVLETAAERQQQAGRCAREQAIEGARGEAEPERWFLGMADADLAQRRGARLETWAEAARAEAERAREAMLERRMERRQAEILQEAAAGIEEKRAIRNEQNRTDDWFQSRRAGRKREARIRKASDSGRGNG